MTSSEPVQGLKSCYRSGRDNLGRDFFAPCLVHCDEYKRAAGYFSSSALVSWAAGLPRIVRDAHVKLKLIISPELSEQDKEVLIGASDPTDRQVAEQHIVNEYFTKAINFSEAPEQVALRLELFAWLVRQQRLEFRLALVEGPTYPGIYHEKYGVFKFPENDAVAFIGSANESQRAYERNCELVMVFRSWVEADAHRIRELEAEFDEAWSGRTPGLRLYEPSREVLARLATIAERSSVAFQAPANVTIQRPPPWPHQQHAVDAFIEARRGVLEMATGTGKTRAALEIVVELLKRGAIDTFVVTTDGNDLLSQWYTELLKWGRDERLWNRVFRHFLTTRQRESYILDPSAACLVISRDTLGPLLNALSSEQKSRLLVIHDEVHGLGAPGTLASLDGKHASVSYVLGLSATPEREYDEDGTKFIETEIGPVLFTFGLEEAIRAGILCELDYVPLPYELTEEDRRRLKNVWSMKAARKAEGRPMSDAEVAIELAKVYKTAEMKPQIFSDYLAKHPGTIKNAIVFVETKEFGGRVLPIIQEHTTRYKTYYADDEAKYLANFSRGLLDCLVTCHKLSQGIDIAHLDTVVIFSSARARLETIQRIGRCLRIDKHNPNKRARVVDFVLRAEESGPEVRASADQDRCEWLHGLSNIRKEVLRDN